jgi:hypothetical protein
MSEEGLWWRSRPEVMEVVMEVAQTGFEVLGRFVESR